MISRLVLASGNPGKLREFARLHAPLGIDVVAQRELGIAEADEPHPTFIENALAKSFTPVAAKGERIDPSGLNSDLHGSAEYRAHLISVMASRAVAAIG